MSRILFRYPPLTGRTAMEGSHMSWYDTSRMLTVCPAGGNGPLCSSVAVAFKVSSLVLWHHRLSLESQYSVLCSSLVLAQGLRTD